jgi:hypothetical protein
MSRPYPNRDRIASRTGGDKQSVVRRWLAQRADDPEREHRQHEQRHERQDVDAAVDDRDDRQ